MSILSRIRSWFGGAKSSPNTLYTSETSPQKATKEIEKHDSKAEKLIEAMKVAYEEQPQSDPVQPLVIQPESTPSQDIPAKSELTQSDTIQPLAIQPENMIPQNIQPVQHEDIQSLSIPTQPENTPSQDIQLIQPIQPECTPSQKPEDILSQNIQTTQPDQPRLKVKRTRRSRSNNPKRSRSRKKLEESANPAT